MQATGRGPVGTGTFQIAVRLSHTKC